MLQKTALVLLALVPLCRGGDKYSNTNTQRWDFLPAGQVELRVRYGYVHIVPGDDSHIALSYTMHSNHSDFDRQVEPQFEVKGSKAVLTLKAPHSGNTEVNIKLPARTETYLRASPGDITIGPNKRN